MADTYMVRLAQTNYYDVVVKAEGVADARRAAKATAATATTEHLNSLFFSTGPFEPVRAHKLKTVKVGKKK